MKKKDMKYFFTKNGSLRKRKDMGDFTEELIMKFLQMKYPKNKVIRGKKGQKGVGIDLMVQGRMWVEVKWQDCPRYIGIYSRTFEKHLKSKWFFKRYYVYLVYDMKEPKLKIIPPSRVFDGVDIKKLMRFKLGKYWWDLEIVLSPKICNDLEPIRLYDWFKKHKI
jgi:hypothetical protein